MPPCQLRIRPEGADLVICWSRRSLQDLDAWTCAEPPVGAGRERYRLRILSGGVVVRTVEVAESRFVYPAALREADGVGGGFDLRVAQVSDQWGPGPETGVLWNG